LVALDGQRPVQEVDQHRKRVFLDVPSEDASFVSAEVFHNLAERTPVCRQVADPNSKDIIDESSKIEHFVAMLWDQRVLLVAREVQRPQHHCGRRAHPGTDELQKIHVDPFKRIVALDGDHCRDDSIQWGAVWEFTLCVQVSQPC